MNVERERRLKKAYAQIPEVECKGLCQTYCGPIPVAPVEEERLTEKCGSAPGVNEDTGLCDRLTPDGKCSIYEHRPFICRAFGAVKHPQMTCPHGCKVKGGAISDDRSRQIHHNIMTM